MMSSIEEDSGSADMEENPDPEDDIGLPQRYDELDGGVPEDEHAEEDLGMIGAVVSYGSQGMPDNGNEIVDMPSESTNNVEASTVVNFHDFSEDCVVLGSESPRDKITEGNKDFAMITNENCFKENENTLIAVCGSGLICQTSSTGDTQLLNNHAPRSNHNEKDILYSVYHVLESKESDCVPEVGSISTETSESKLESLYIENDVIGTSQIVNVASKSTDNEVSLAKHAYSSPENSIESSAGQSSVAELESMQQSSPSTNLGESFDKTESDSLCVTNTEDIPQAMSSVLNKHENIVCDNLQNPESHTRYTDDTKLLNMMPEALELVAGEVYSPVHVLPGNYSGGLELTAERDFTITGQELDFKEVIPEFMPRDTGASVPLPVKFCVEACNVETGPSEHQNMPVVADCEHNISQSPDAQKQSNSCHAASCLNQPTDNSQGYQQNIPGDHSQHFHLPQINSQLNQQHLHLDTATQHSHGNINGHMQIFKYNSQDGFSYSDTSSLPTSPCKVAVSPVGSAGNQKVLESTSSPVTSPYKMAVSTTGSVGSLRQVSESIPSVTSPGKVSVNITGLLHSADDQKQVSESTFSPVTSPYKTAVSTTGSAGSQRQVSEYTSSDISPSKVSVNTSLLRSADGQKQVSVSSTSSPVTSPYKTAVSTTDSAGDLKQVSEFAPPVTSPSKASVNITGCSASDQKQVSESTSSPVTSPCKTAVSGKVSGGNQKQIMEFLSEGCSPTSSQQASPTKTAPYAKTIHFMEKEQTSAEKGLLEDEILLDLDADLHQTSANSSPLKKLIEKASWSDKRIFGKYINGMQSSFNIAQIQEYNKQLLEQLQIRDDEIARLTAKLHSEGETKKEVDSWRDEYQLSPSHHADDLYLPQIKVLEHTIAAQQKEIQELKGKLMSQDSSAKRAITTLQHELKSRVEQVTKLYEECRKEKDMIVVRFAESEAKHIEARRVVEKSEAKVKEAMREKELMMNAVKTAKADKQRALSNFEAKCIEITNVQKEIEKLKEAVNSSDHRIKWFQNKLKEELESHKETKGNLEKMTAKLKEAKEETELIRKECQAIVKRYQESDEIKSNSLDKELKLKETELKTHMQEMSDTEEIHQILKKELDSLKAQHKDVIEEAKIYKDKVNCLEEERRQNHEMIENYQEIIQRQKTGIAELNMKIASISSLNDDYQRSQDTIQALHKDITDLEMTNQELLKDMESCRERESKMLTLQSELSLTSALLRSENTSLSNKVSSLTSEVVKHELEVQALEADVTDLKDKCDREKAKAKEEAENLAAILAERTKECNELRQKWEDAMDSSKTLKRQHANNIKDLTRQLHQMHKRLESIEGKGDAGSMGSRTNSNGSLNSLENSRQTFPANHHPVQEFPAITEQVEVDKQVLIERIVRLQKSLARKNEKLEFLGEHVQQLLEDIRKKNKIIQMYALREESGTLSSEEMDANKAKVQKEMQLLFTRKGGIMASLYSAHQQDGTMTLELSLQISRKLQAVLEDTLLKNMTLKESLDTLGEEIARLSQENRRMQLHLQKLEGNLA